MVVLCTKLKRLKIDLRKWNKECFGNVFMNVQQVEQKLMEAEKMVDLITQRHQWKVYIEPKMNCKIIFLSRKNFGHRRHTQNG